MTKKILLLTTLILNSSLYSDTTTLKNGKVYKNAKVFHKGDTVTVSFECGKQIVFNKSEISETEIKPLTRWKTQEECNQTEEEAKQAAEKRKEEEATITGTITLRNGKVYPNAKIFYIDKDVTAELECGKKIVSKRSESQVVIKPLTRWKTQEECNKSEEEARLKEEKRLQEEHRRQELALKKQECEDKGDVWNGIDCKKKKSVTPVIPDDGKWSSYQGKMNWYDARAKCESIGMRLPTIGELDLAYTTGITKTWNETGFFIAGYAFWTSEGSSEGGIRAFGVNDGTDSIYNGSEDLLVRCFR